jgi:hypothetical protein
LAATLVGYAAGLRWDVGDGFAEVSRNERDHGGIDGMMSIFDDAGVEKQIERRGGVVKVDANFLSGTATIVYDETRVSVSLLATCSPQLRGASSSPERGTGDAG